MSNKAKQPSQKSDQLTTTEETCTALVSPVPESAGLPTRDQIEGERLLKLAVGLEKLHEAKAIESGAIQTTEGCLLLSAKRKLRGTEDDKQKQREFFNTMLKQYDLSPRTADRRIQLWEKMYDCNVVDSKVLVAIEEAEEITPELLAMVQAKVGNKSGTDLMREFGILPPKETSKEKVAKSAATRLKEKKTMLHAILKEIGLLLDGDEIQKEIPDKNIIAGLRKGYEDCNTSWLLFAPLDKLEIPDITIPDLPTMPAGSMIQLPKL